MFIYMVLYLIIMVWIQIELSENENKLIEYLMTKRKYITKSETIKNIISEAEDKIKKECLK